MRQFDGAEVSIAFALRATGQIREVRTHIHPSLIVLNVRFVGRCHEGQLAAGRIASEYPKLSIRTALAVGVIDIEGQSDMVARRCANLLDRFARDREIVPVDVASRCQVCRDRRSRAIVGDDIAKVNCALIRSIGFVWIEFTHFAQERRVHRSTLNVNTDLRIANVRKSNRRASDFLLLLHSNLDFVTTGRDPFADQCWGCQSCRIVLARFLRHVAAANAEEVIVKAAGNSGQYYAEASIERIHA